MLGAYVGAACGAGSRTLVAALPRGARAGKSAPPLLPHRWSPARLLTVACTLRRPPYVCCGSHATALRCLAINRCGPRTALCSAATSSTSTDTQPQCPSRATFSTTPKMPAASSARHAPAVVDREAAVAVAAVAVVATTNAALNLQSPRPPLAPLGRALTYSSFRPIILRHSHRSRPRSHVTVTGKP